MIWNKRINATEIADGYPKYEQQTLGATSSSSPFCSLHSTFSVLSPAIPKLTECIRQKEESQMRELKRFWIRESPIQTTSGSPSRASLMNLWC